MPATTFADPPSGALTPEARRELTQAQTRARPILKATRVASFNGWSLGVIAGCSALFTVVSFSVIGLLTTLGLAAVAYNEFRGRRQLLAFDPGGATLLGWNQVALLTLVSAYCGWMLYSGLTGAGPMAAELEANPELGEALGSLGDFDSIYRQLVVLIYATIIVVTIIVQGLNAYYYFTRRKHVEKYLQETPAWAVEMQRLSAGS